MDVSYKTAAGIETVGVTDVLGVLLAVSSTTSAAVPCVATIVIEYVHEVTKIIVAIMSRAKKIDAYVIFKSDSICIYPLYIFCDDYDSC